MFRTGLLVIMAVLISACSLPSQEGRQFSQALLGQQTMDTTLGRALAPLAQQHPGTSGVVTLADSLDAFAARILLIEAAQRVIDIQYYIWRDDITGNLMLRALHEAAQRDVRVRVLVDDNGTVGLDGKLALLNAEPNISVRLFNPFPFRTFKQLGFLTDFSRLNRRMHNKSLTVDGQVTIVGGRNIGDEYFGATEGIAFSDLDVMVAGPAVDDVSHDFDRYWNSQSAYPLENLVAMPRPDKARRLLQEEVRAALIPSARAYVEAIAKSTFVESLVTGSLEYHWVPVRMVSDDPAKVLGKAGPEAMLFPRLMEILGRPAHSVDLISPYFVPTEAGVEAFGALAQQGVELRVLTNSMAATDVLPVHAGYAKYRVPLLHYGVELYEMRRDSSPDTPKEKAGPFGSSGSSLHAKTFAVDGDRAFVGSFNFDPRSARLNTELGFVIESEAIARAISDVFERDVPRQAWRLALDEKDELVWLEQTAGEDRVLTSEPSASFWRRLYIGFLSLLPIESLL